MAMLPLMLFDDLFDMEQQRRRRLLDWDKFDIITPKFERYGSPRLRNHRNCLCNEAYPKVGKDGFQVSMNVKEFQPNELSVKTVDDSVVIEGKHEERQDDYGYISRNFVRKFTLPKGYDSKEVISSLSSDGVLTVKAPPPQALQGKQERLIQIQQTGPAHLNIKDIPKNNEVDESNKSKE